MSLMAKGFTLKNIINKNKLVFKRGECDKAMTDASGVGD
jgi:hypothetical protein